jgi:hypothetical protein
VSCPSSARLAAAASGEDLAASEHLGDCASCRAVVSEQRELIVAARLMRVPPLRVEHRRLLAAEVMARSELEDAQRPWRGGRVMAIAASFVAAAAMIMLVIATRELGSAMPQPSEVASIDEPAIEIAGVARLDPVLRSAPGSLRAAVSSVGADFARARRGDLDIVTLRDGEVSIDATDREPVTIVSGDTRVTIAGSRAKIVARGGVIVTTHVFAGTAQVTANGRSLVVDGGDVWMREPEVNRDEHRIADSLAAFRTGWEALRAHHHPQAIAAFDRATDPVVAEDATFWAAIATERAGDSEGAAVRLRRFLELFPSSPRAEAARAALQRVTE